MTFWIGEYEDKVLCDVVAMQVEHLLLVQPWQFDRHVKHDGFTSMMASPTSIHLFL